MIEIRGLPQLSSLTSRKTHVTVIDFYADWCGPCQAIKPEYERIAQFYDSNKVTFCKCNVDRNRDCSSAFNIEAMPTFVVCHGGQTIDTIRGGDLGAVQRVINMAMDLIPKTGGHRLGSSAGSGSGAQAAVAGPRQHALADHMLTIDRALKDNDPIAAKDACDAAYNSLMKKDTPTSQHPAGLLLLPYLASDAFSSAAVDALLRNIRTRDESCRDDGAFLINQVLRYIVEIACAITWDDVATAQVLHKAINALLKCSAEAQEVVINSVYFHSELIQTGIQLERYTVLGALLGIGPTPRSDLTSAAMMTPGQLSNIQWATVLKMFPSNQLERHPQLVYETQQTVELYAQLNFSTVKALLSSKVTRDTTLKYLGNTLRLNEDYQKTMHQDSPLSSRFFMAQLQAVLIDVALPLFNASRAAAAPSPNSSSPTSPASPGTAEEFPPSYLLPDLRNPVVVRFGQRGEVERIQHYDDANALPTCQEPIVPYKPSVHIFFLAARVLTLCATVFIDEHTRDERSATHPQVPQAQRNAHAAEKALYEALIAGNALATKRLELLNGLAGWLLWVMRAGPDGTLPLTPSVEWNYLPQQLVDCVIRATQMAPVDGLFIDGMISFMLVMMGNTTYFPKPHTQVLFPSFLVRLLQDYTTKNALERHPWFTEHIVRACVYCYMAVEKCTYEKVEVRYELSHCIKGFLESDMLCQPVRHEFDQKTEVLERFSHMAVADVNEAVDQLIDTLTKMHEREVSGADLSENAEPPTGVSGDDQQRRQRRRGGAEANEEGDDESSSDNEGVIEGQNTDRMTYDQMGRSLRSHIMLFNALIDMFIQLSIKFPKGVSQNMVAQQISQMLARSLIAFAGPKSTSLKIKSSAKYGFNPREILSRLVDCFTHFRRSKGFLKCLCKCGVPLEEIQRAMKMVVDRQLVSETLLGRLVEMSTALTSILKIVDNEDALWENAPDFALDALLATPLTNPVALPAEVKDLDDLVYVNQDTIHHYLLSDSKHPFTNEYLDEKLLNEFNARPEIAAARDALNAKIDAWLAEARNAVADGDA